ncbi:MAG TPA: PAS domain S-box protein [Clostridiaceae bacterium]|nr:PAS domain S-box protein [Clostridiaceae bacterium]
MNANIDDNGIKPYDSSRKLFLRSLLPIIVIIPLSIFVHTIFISNYALFHTILELTCIYTNLFLFFSIWLVYDKVGTPYKILGFGYLIVAIFDILHTFFFLEINTPSGIYSNYYAKFQILGRFSQAIVLYIYTQHIKIFKNETFKETKLKNENLKVINFFFDKHFIFNKYFALTIIIIGVTIISYFVFKVNLTFFRLFTSDGTTPLKSILEGTVMLILFLTLIKAKTIVHSNSKSRKEDNYSKEDNFFNNNNSQINYESYYLSPNYITLLNKYIIPVLIAYILSEACFIHYPSINSCNLTVGHILKVFANIYFLKGIIIGTMNYPYICQLEQEHKNLKETLKEANELTTTLNEILDTLPEAIIRFDNNGIMRHVNKKFEDLLGYSEEDLYGLTETECLKITSASGNFNDSSTNTTDANANSIDNSNYTSDIDNHANSIIRTYKTKSGENVKLRVSKHKISSGYLIILHDIRREQELQNINLQTQTILDAVSNIILMIDKNKKVVLCNKALEEMFDAKKEKLIGMNVSVIYKFIDERCRQLLDAALEGHESNQLHEVSFQTDDKRKTLLVHITPIYNIDKDIIGVIIAGTDITELKAQQEALVQQEKLAVLGQMGAGIVHETRNYLSTIKGRIQLIDMLTENQTIKNHIAKINSNIDELNTIMSEFLFLSKPRHSTLQEASMYDIVRSIKGMIEASSIIKGVTVEFDLSEEERYLLCDESQIKQVILNICKNAVEAMVEQKYAKLKISTGYNKQTNEMFIKISDNGKGIAKEDLEKIGTPFFTTKQKGTGLGLNICYGIIKEHNGRIEVESELGKGTTFTIILPCIPDEENNHNNFSLDSE